MQASTRTVDELDWDAFRAKPPAERRQLTDFLDNFDLSRLPRKECNDKRCRDSFSGTCCQTTTVDYAELEDSMRRDDIEFISREGYTEQHGRLVLQPQLVSHDLFFNALLSASVMSPTESNRRVDPNSWGWAIESNGSIRMKKNANGSSGITNYRIMQEGKQRKAIQRRSEYAACVVDSRRPGLTSSDVATDTFACFPIKPSRASIGSGKKADLQLGEMFELGSKYRPFAICRSFVQATDHPYLDPIRCFTRLYQDCDHCPPDLLCIGFTLSWPLAAKINELSRDYGHWEHFLDSLSAKLHQKDNENEKSKCIKQEIVHKLGLDHEEVPQFKMECWRMFLGGCIKLMDYAVPVDDDFLGSSDPFNNDEYRGKAERFLNVTGLRFPVGAVSTRRIEHVIDKEYYGPAVSHIISRHPRNETEYSNTEVAFKIHRKDETHLIPRHLRIARVDRSRFEPTFQNGLCYYTERAPVRDSDAVQESAQTAVGRNALGRTDYFCSKFDAGSLARIKEGNVIEILDEKLVVVDHCYCRKIRSSCLGKIPSLELPRAHPIKAWRKALSKYASRDYLARDILPQMYSLTRKKVKVCFERMIYGAVGEEHARPRSEGSCDGMISLEAEVRDLAETSGLRHEQVHKWTLSDFSAQDLTPTAARRIITGLLEQTTEWLAEGKCVLGVGPGRYKAPDGYFFPAFFELYELSSVLSAIVDAFQGVFEDVAQSTGWPCHEWDDSMEHLRTWRVKLSGPVKARKKSPSHKEHWSVNPDRLFDCDSDYLRRLCMVFKWIHSQLILMRRVFYKIANWLQDLLIDCNWSVHYTDRYLAEILLQRYTMPLSFQHLPKFTTNLLVHGSCNFFFQLTGLIQGNESEVKGEGRIEARITNKEKNSSGIKRARLLSMTFDVYKLIRDHVIGEGYSKAGTDLESVWFQTFEGKNRPFG